MLFVIYILNGIFEVIIT